MLSVFVVLQRSRHLLKDQPAVNAQGVAGGGIKEVLRLGTVTIKDTATNSRRDSGNVRCLQQNIDIKLEMDVIIGRSVFPHVLERDPVIVDNIVGDISLCAAAKDRGATRARLADEVCGSLFWVGDVCA